MKYYIIVGEASGDVHGAKLMRGIKDNDPDAQFRFWGGDRMVGEGGAENLVFHYRDNAFMGLVEVLRHFGSFLRRFRICREDIRAWSPDVVIFIDFGGFNLRMAKRVKKMGFRTFYYITPKIWAWNESRAKKIRKYVDEVFVILSFEVDFFAKHGIKAHYLGNPIVDEVEQKRKSVDVAAFRAKYGLDVPAEEYTIALLAGSRRQEIEYNLPVMVDLANAMPRSRFLLAGVSWLEPSLYEKCLAKSAANNIVPVIDSTYEALLSADGAVVTSGTAALETALLAVPEVVVYRCNYFTFNIGRKVVNIRYLSLANLMFDKPVIDECLQEEMTVPNIIRALRAAIEPGARRDEQQADYVNLRDAAGEEGSSVRVAKKMVKLLKS